VLPAIVLLRTVKPAGRIVPLNETAPPVPPALLPEMVLLVSDELAL